MFEYEGIKTAGVSDYTNQTPNKHFGWVKSPSPTALKIRIFNKYAQKEGAHVQCMNKHYAKFKY